MFPHHFFWKGCSLPSELLWQPSQKSIDYIYMCFLETQFNSIDPITILIPGACCFGYCSFVVRFEVNSFNLSSYVLHFQHCFDYGVPCICVSIINLFIFAKGSWNFDRDWIDYARTICSIAVLKFWVFQSMDMVCPCIYFFQ